MGILIGHEDASIRAKQRNRLERVVDSFNRITEEHREQDAPRGFDYAPPLSLAEELLTASWLSEEALGTHQAAFDAAVACEFGGGLRARHLVETGQ